MMTNNPLIIVPLKFGLVGGFVTILMFLIAYWIGKNPIIDLRFFDFIILPIFLFFTMKEFRDYRNDRILHFWQGMTAGVLNYLTISVISALFIYLFLDLGDDGLIEQYIADRLSIIDLKKDELIKQMGDDIYEKSRNDILAVTAATLAFDDFLKKCLIGLTLTIPIAVILRRTGRA